MGTAVFDAHFHIIDPRFPVMENQGFLPPTFTVDDYLSRTARLGIRGGTVIAGSFQGTQTEYMYDALEKLSIDHLGMTQAGLPKLIALAGRGAKVKATGFGRTEVDVPHALKEIARENPDSLMFGSDLPSQRARRPFEPADKDLIRDTLGDALAQKVFHDNAAAFYRPRQFPENDGR
jgi:predicted TIM-barrel fold metal-dependent hydrolase